MRATEQKVRDVELSGVHTTPPGVRRVIDVTVLGLAIVLALLVLLPVYGTSTVLLPIVGGVLLGALVVLVARERGWSSFVVVGLTLGVYLLLGGALAAPSTTVARVVPSLETLVSLVSGLVAVWKEMLTLEPPIGPVDNLMVAPFVLALGGTVVAGMLGTVAASSWTGWASPGAARGAHRPLASEGATRRAAAVSVIAASIVPGIVLVVSILLGTVEAPYATVVGLGMAVLLTPWVAWRLRSWHPRRIVTLVLMAGVAVASGLVVTPQVAGDAPRTVLRNEIVPPFDPNDHASPLAAWRRYVKDFPEKPLFRVEGLPEGSLVRLATMDAFDGVVWNVADESASSSTGAFRRVGEQIPTNVTGTRAEVAFTIEALDGVWMPMVGQTTSLTFEGRRSREQQRAFRFNDATGGAVLPEGLRAGDRYRAETIVPEVPSDEELASAVAATIAQPELERVPDSVAQRASTIASEAASPALVARAVEATLQQGWFSHGIEAAGDYPSLSGHGAARIDELLTGELMVGDGEQYASAMALMARHLGLPARVVMGFRAPDGATSDAEITGNEIQAWVEIAYERYGWVPYFPTPDESRTPSEETEPQDSEPQPEVVQPPPPPEDPVTPPKEDIENPEVDSDDEIVEDPTDWRLIVTLTLSIAVPVLVVVLPPFLILAAKARRQRRRRTAPAPLDRVTGAWDEVLDAAHDRRELVSRFATRAESARALEASFPGVRVQPLARSADTAVFGPGLPSEADAEALWAQADDVVAGIAAHGTRWQRFRGRISLASLRARAQQRRAERRERDALLRAELLRQGGPVVQTRRSRLAEWRTRRAQKRG
ncbi:transglutaminase superfamily protein [Flavimobilis soli]|uniref:Transglutaminase superfamily protein n=1 Tax=Flavimobilis soli TaxID=442709 RepID=A0A2A9EC18_9MICO|nr:transglutaminase domain-containing protein [Flavimobilis soli]PFG36468.1 transglutaminase superfamily protein [Flavimobilis soli]